MKRLISFLLLSSLLLLSACAAGPPNVTEELSSAPAPETAPETEPETAAETEPPEPEAGFTVVTGACATSATGVTSEKANSLALYTRPFTDGTATGTLTPGTVSKTGVIFRVSDDLRSYYFFGINDSKQVFLSRVENGKETVVSAMAVSAGYNGTDSRSLRITAKDDLFYCYLNNNCYVCFRDPEPLSGTGIGFRTTVAGAKLAGFSLKKNVTEPLKADVLIWGHSHMQLWSQSKSHLASLGSVQNFGVGGSGTVYWMTMIDELCSYEPKYMIVMIGSNDYASASAAKITERTFSILEEIRGRLPEVKIVLLTEFLQPTRLEYTDKVNELNARYKALAAEQNDLAIADLYDVALDKNGAFDKSRFRDSYHLKETYYTEVRDRVLAAAKTFGPREGAEGFDVLSGSFRTDDGFLSSAAGSRMLKSGDRVAKGAVGASVTPSEKTGILFAADETGSSAYLFSLENGVPKLEKNGALLAAGNALKGEAPYAMQVRFADGLIECLCDGAVCLSARDAAPLTGDRFGFYAAGQDAKFARVSFEETDGDGRYVFPLGDSAAWTVETDESGNTTYVCNTPAAPLMFDGILFDGGTVEFDMTVVYDSLDTNYYRYKAATGVLFGAESLTVDHSTGTFYVFGRCPWGTCTGYSKHREPGAAKSTFHWEDTNKSKTKLAVGREYHYKIVWNPEKNNVTLSVDGKLFSVSPLDYALDGRYVGLCSDVIGTRYRNVVFSPEVS